jgi:hypothetical protein
MIDYNCNRSANESNHPIQNPLLLVTEPRTRDSILVCLYPIYAAIFKTEKQHH